MLSEKPEEEMQDSVKGENTPEQETATPEAVPTPEEQTPEKEDSEADKSEDQGDGNDTHRMEAEDAKTQIAEEAVPSPEDQSLEKEDSEADKREDQGEGSDASRMKAVDPETEVAKDAVSSSEEQVSEKEEPKAEESEDQDDGSDTYRMEADDSETEIADLDKPGLVAKMEEVAKMEDLKEAATLARVIRDSIEKIFNEEQEAAREQFLDEGNEAADFNSSQDELQRKFYEAYNLLKGRRSDQRDRLEAEKQKNLFAKRDILEKLKVLTETDETEDSLNQVKALQSEWKKIRAVPREFVQELWDSYRFLLDKFYDNLSINFELKELDRKKNLEFKIELCKKVDVLQDEPSIKKAMNALNKLHDEWKHTGPVPKEYNEEIWLRFKAASDKVYEAKKAQMTALNESRKKNLELKTALLEKLQLVAEGSYSKPKEWIQKTDEIAKIFEEWRGIGPVPKEHNDSIWVKFKDFRNGFYRQKNVFFKELNKQKQDNLEKKLALCEKAEVIKDDEDWNKTTQDLIRLQAEWKKIGPVTDKRSDEVWKRFRSACDTFFNKKEEHFKGQIDEQQKNLEIKDELIKQLKALMEKDDVEAVFKEVKEIQKSWHEAGFVPFKQKNRVNKEFSSSIDALYKKFKKKPEEMSEVRLKDHFKDMAELPDGERRLQQEEKRIRDRIRFIKNDLETLENNIGFFSNSKSAGGLIKGIQDKIDKSNGQIDRLKKELSIIKSYK